MAGVVDVTRRTLRSDGVDLRERARARARVITAFRGPTGLFSRIFKAFFHDLDYDRAYLLKIEARELVHRQGHLLYGELCTTAEELATWNAFKKEFVVFMKSVSEVPELFMNETTGEWEIVENKDERRRGLQLGGGNFGTDRRKHVRDLSGDRH